jgi:tRNA threonylcarbamoyladenosine biosynthesis protein TsaE
MLRFTRESTASGYTVALARGLGSILRGGETITLSGDLGAGKTTFTRGVATGLGISERLVSSPTFAIINEYDSRPGTPTLVHIDAYRLRGEEELEGTGFERYVRPLSHEARSTYVLIVEWPERVERTLAKERAIVRLDQIGVLQRTIHFELPESWRTRPGVREMQEREPVRCRTTGVWVSPTVSTYPFADERARMADLGKWFNEQHRIPGKPAEEDGTDDDIV